MYSEAYRISQINALAVYKIFSILGRAGEGGVYWRGALIREGNLFKRNRIDYRKFSFLNVLKLQFSIYEIIFRIAGVYEIIVRICLLCIAFRDFKGIAAFDSRFCCSFNISKPFPQGWPSFLQASAENWGCLNKKKVILGGAFFEEGRLKEREGVYWRKYGI